MGEERLVEEMYQCGMKLGEIASSLDPTSQAAMHIKEEISKLEITYGCFQEQYLDFRKIIESISDAIHISDSKGKILFVNQAYIKSTGILQEEILGRYVDDIIEEGKLYNIAATPIVIETLEEVSIVGKLFGANKKTLNTGIPIFDNEKNLKYVFTYNRDQRNLKQFEQALEKMQKDVNKDREELAYLRKQQRSRRNIVCVSESMQSVLELARTVAKTDVTVLITGESGTGKELVTEEIYENSHRRDQAFIKVNCAAIPAELLESELFGYEGGSFTDARKGGKQGLFELANHGVILLDEIGDMPLNLQSKLLRVLQQREIMRVGGEKVIKVDVRVLASTNKDLSREIAKGSFREDLYYRLNVIPIHIYPLRKRKEDIRALTMDFLSIYNKQYSKHITIQEDALQVFELYDWPGNIRELENLMERLVVINLDGMITARNVSMALNLPELLAIRENGIGLREYLQLYEKELLQQALQREGSKRKAAKVMGIDHSTMVKKCKLYGIVCEKDPVTFITTR